jgi:putative acetyltransferase
MSRSQSAHVAALERIHPSLSVLYSPADWESINLYIPGCVEHYLVHTMREHDDFIQELDFVLELDGVVIGYIMYTKAALTDDDGNVKNILTFGPLCIEPEHQRRGYGKLLIQHSFEKATAMGYDTVVIFGAPSNYVSSGFVSCKKLNVCVEGGKFPTAMLVRELKTGALDGRRWYYKGSPVMEVLPEKANAYDDTLPPKERKHTPAQEEFYIMSHSFVE